MLANENRPDILGRCEIDKNISDEQVSISGYEFVRKDRCVTTDKVVGSVLLYYKNSLNCQRRELEIANVETLWRRSALPKSKYCNAQYTGF